ncbi:MAG TPA: ParB/RepB/Spo0J family partition protein [Phycisphaerae bacterium]|nr:ParB/RepB/Spo0J family partition protein [Phycisphaerae bacterium]
MSKSARRLGRGLDSLVTDLRGQERANTSAPDGEEHPHAPPTEPPSAGAALVELDRLSPNPFQPRDIATEESLAPLADSLRTSGMIQPISVRARGDRFEIIAGERRWHAARMAGLKAVPVVVHQATDHQMLEMALVENIQREDLNPVDRARGYRQYCDDFAAAPEELARRLGEDRTTVTNYLRLLDLPDEVKEMLAAGRISMGHARCIVGIADDGERLRLARAVVANALSVRALEEVVRRTKPGRGKEGEKPPRSRDKTPHVADLEERCSVAVGTKVVIQEGRRKGSGRIVIDYYSLDDFDRIIDRLGIERE